MKLLALFLIVVLLAGCAGPVNNITGPDNDITIVYETWSLPIVHDADRAVTCWGYNGHGISCLPDSALNHGDGS